MVLDKKKKRIAIIQSNYIPWKGYFDIIRSVDEFVLFDDVQYTRRDWRNRNKIKTPDGLIWLTIPLQTSGNYFEKIMNMKVASSEWARTHWTQISRYYREAPFFSEFNGTFDKAFQEASKMERLSEINRYLIEVVNSVLGITTKITWSMDYQIPESDKSNRLINLCQAAGADHYVSGPAAKVYLDEQSFRESGLTLSYFDYSHYPPYRQLYGNFTHEVSVLDLIFNEGKNAVEFLSPHSSSATC